jgi:signal transduction histidine kinase
VPPAEQHFILSGLSPGPAQKRLALAIVLGLLTVFMLIAFSPLARVQPRRVDAFVPAYVMAMFLCDSITAILLFAQYSITRSVAILAIASGYLFVALILIPYIMVFPDLLAPGNMLGGLQSTSFLWMCQHSGFALFVFAYALFRKMEDGKRVGPFSMRAPIAVSITGTVAIVLLAAFVCIAGSDSLPRVASDTLHFTSLWPYYIGAPVAAATIAALVALWFRRRTVLDLWLTVIMCLYAIEVPLSYYPVPSRFSVGWYTVRVIAILGSSLVLIVLLYEISTLYAKLLRAVYAQRREREARLMTGDAVAAAIAHEVRQPLTAMITTADAGWRFLDRASPNLDKAKEAFRRITADGHRAGDVIGNIRATYRNDARDWTDIVLNELIHEALVLGHDDLEKHGIAVEADAGSDKLAVRGNRVQLQQVLLNLITNAIDAMVSKDEPRILAVKCDRHESDLVTVSVADNGSGIPANEADRIFTPLFTTKSEGMGMGLAICRSIIEAHEGRLWFTANAPRGAAFHFTLPCRE